MIAYVYDIDSKMVIAKIVGNNNADIERLYADKIGDQDELAMTYSPAFGCNDGLIDTSNAITYKA